MKSYEYGKERKRVCNIERMSVVRDGSIDGRTYSMNP